ncbi:PcfB family protein [Christensenellaceae bacterium OttesenSCG-928-M15]|nr:PcfB family protein [Christensenellaceae bacterium OttesenSCG-928-M15]
MATTITTETVKTAADITAKSLMQILTMMLTNNKNTSEQKKNILRDIIAKPHDVFFIPKERMREFAKRCKEYNIPFFVVKRTKSGPEPFVDVIVREMDRGAVNRIAEQLGITLSSVEQARQGMDDIRTHAEDAGDVAFAAAPENTVYSVDEDVLSQMLGVNLHTN